MKKYRRQHKKYEKILFSSNLSVSWASAMLKIVSTKILIRKICFELPPPSKYSIILNNVSIFDTIALHSSSRRRIFRILVHCCLLKTECLLLSLCFGFICVNCTFEVLHNLLFFHFG